MIIADVAEVKAQIRDTCHSLLCADEPTDETGRGFYMLAVHALQQAEAFLGMAIAARTPKGDT